MNKQEFIDTIGKAGEFSDEFKAIYNSPELIWNFITENVLPQAIAEYEAEQWKPYPENQPSDEVLYIATLKSGLLRLIYGYNFHILGVIAFHKLPALFKGKEERK